MRDRTSARYRLNCCSKLESLIHFPVSAAVALKNSLPVSAFPVSEWVQDKKLSGKLLAEALRRDTKTRAAKLTTPPGLAVIIVGDDEASKIYVAGKEKAAAEAGFYSLVSRLPASSQQEDIIAKIHEYNNDPRLHGILVQLPMPGHLKESEILQAIRPEKDADGFHFINQGRLLAGADTVLPCTPAGITLMLRELDLQHKLSLAGKHAVVVGRSNIVGKPMAQLLLSVLNMTVTTCHSKTQNLKDFVSSADVLVSATGVRGIVDCSVIKKGAIVIDVGMHRIDGKVTGDLDLAVAAERAQFYTPVPGGVGPMTIAMLLYNTYHNAERLQAQTLVA